MGKSSINGGFSSQPCLITGGYIKVLFLPGFGQVFSISWPALNSAAVSRPSPFLQMGTALEAGSEVDS